MNTPKLMKPYLLFGVLTTLFSFNIHSQSTDDSLLYERYAAKAKQYYYTHPDSNLIYSDSLISMGQQHGYPKASAYGLKMKGVYYHFATNKDSALYYYTQSMAAYLIIRDSLSAAKSQLNAAMIFTNTGRFDSALSYSLGALRTFEHQRDSNMMGRTIGEVAKVHSLNGDHEKALPYFMRTLELALQSQDVESLANAYNFLTTVYTYLEKYDSSLYYGHKTIPLFMEIKNKPGLGATYVTIANVFKKRNNYDSANYYYNKAIAITEETQYTKGLGEIYYNQGTMEAQRNQLRKAQNLFEQALPYSLDAGHQDLALLIQRDIASTAAQLGDYPKAYKYQVMYQASNDSVFNQQKQQSLVDVQTKYETEKKEQQIALQQALLDTQAAELKINQLIFAGMIGILILIVVIGLLQRKKILLKQSNELERQKTLAKESQLAAALSSQESERKRFARDLHDGFGQMISLLNLNLASLEKNQANREEVYQASSAVLDDMYQELKSICFNLMPETLIQQGVAAATQEFVLRVNQTQKIHIELDTFGMEGRLTDLQEISLYRIIQEWINNLLKYSDAQKATLSLTRDEEEITLLIEDNGAGFDQTKLRQGSGNGWKNITSRSNLIHGEITLDTQLGVQGTTLIINAPYIVESEKLKSAIK
ncbi:tetratricopeptide repeat protein [Reichenbachiella agariperforans]|uniref:tetratricopeptide repeat protein n=1 Tax=Reichenbachiella agariperforans TaxID=156994 RepID=UPI001C0A2F6E|nr:tetratricopeptide repeat protein [Reichenbachiella agariperforans]MBU2915688.1 tetratricopeptide repeat protein [Reichenbachiella agariperforans]